MFIGDSNQSHPEWLSRMLPLSYTRYTISRVTPLSQLIKSHDTVLLVRPGPPLSIRLLHTILAGGHFPPKINDDFCLAIGINTSSMMYGYKWNIYIQSLIAIFENENISTKSKPSSKKTLEYE